MIVEVFPDLQLHMEIHVIRVRQHLVKLCRIRSVGTFHFAVQLWGLRFDVHMSHSLVFDMSVKTSLKLMTSIRSDCADPNGRLFDHVVHEPDRTFLVMGRKDL